MIRRLATCLALAAAGACCAEGAPPTARPMSLSTEQIQTIVDVIDRLKADYVQPLDGDQIVDKAMKGLLEGIDPEGGEFYNRSDYDDFIKGPSASGQQGVGVEMHLRDGTLRLFPVEGGPAAAAGLRSGDTLRSIDGLTTEGLRPQAAARLLRGPTGSHAVLVVTRAGASEAMRFEVERRRVDYPPVRLSRPDPDLAVLRVPPLRDRTLQEAVDALGQEWSRQPFKGLVLDLRQNSGGLLTTAVGVAAIFLQANDVVARTTGRIAESNQVFRAAPEDYLRHGSDPLAALAPALRRVPLVVLVDEGTASGAEIIAAALRDHGRATLVGHPTYGRGSIQTVMPLPHGLAMKITTATYTTPAGASIDGHGLRPDVPVDGDDAAQALQAALAALRRRL